MSLLAGTGSYGAIDTGTTLVTGPTDVINAIYAQIPNSQALDGQNEGLYQFRESRVQYPLQWMRGLTT